MQPIVFIGFMGAGKTATGLALSHLLHWPFVDLDTTIEEQTGCSIPRLFAEKGEAYFRHLEAEALASLFPVSSPLIVAAGGGIVTTPANQEILKNQCYCLFLHPPFETLLARIRHDSPHRPLADQATGQQLEALFQTRLPLYRAVAKATISDSASPQEIAVHIAAQFTPQ